MLTLIGYAPKFWGIATDWLGNMLTKMVKFGRVRVTRAYKQTDRHT